MTRKTRRTGYFFAAAAALAAAGALRLFVLDVLGVEGRSMEPAIPAGSVLVVNRSAYGIRLPFSGRYLVRWGLPAADEVVVFADPRDGSARVKRCAAASGDQVFLRGDNAGDSVDSRLYGSVPVEKIAGKVLLWIAR